MKREGPQKTRNLPDIQTPYSNSHQNNQVCTYFRKKETGLVHISYLFINKLFSLRELFGWKELKQISSTYFLTGTTVLV